MTQTPSPETIAALDAQIDAEDRVPDDEKRASKERLRRLFHLGNLLREDGVDEEWLVTRLPQEFVLLTSWASVTQRRQTLNTLWRRRKQ